MQVPVLVAGGAMRKEPDRDDPCLVEEVDLILKQTEKGVPDWLSW